jgi:hypothetical protein
VATYRYSLSDEQRERLKKVLKIQQHKTITQEIRRELFGMPSATKSGGGTDTLMMEEDE